MINAGKYSHKVSIYKIVEVKNANGFKTDEKIKVIDTYANIKTTRGFTLIANDSSFEKAYTNFTIRYLKSIEETYYETANSNRDMLVSFKNKEYKVEYFNNVDEENVEIELQCKEVMK